MSSKTPPEQIKLYISLTTNRPRRIPIDISKDASLIQLMERVSKATTIPTTAMKLIFAGQIITNDHDNDDSSISILDKYKLDNNCVVHCIGKPTDIKMMLDMDDLTKVDTTMDDTSATPLDTTTTESPMEVSRKPQYSYVVPPPENLSSSSSSSSSSLQSFPPSKTNLSFKEALDNLRSNCNPLNYSEYDISLQTITKIITNILHHPHQEKYRIINKKNLSFHGRFGKLIGSNDVMLALGFEVMINENYKHQFGRSFDDGCVDYILHPTSETWKNLHRCKNELEDVINQPFMLVPPKNE